MGARAVERKAGTFGAFKVLPQLLENETAETLEETYLMARDWNPDMANWAMYTPWPFSDLFLRLIKMLIAPLLFATLVAGIAGAGHFKDVGRMGLRVDTAANGLPSFWIGRLPTDALT